jgi:anti-sigma regulatory factor (Ser/Thr protein kinase)
MTHSEADFLIAMREALANAVTHGNQSDGSKGVFVSYACEANETLSIVVRDEGNGFEPIHFLSPNEGGKTRKGEFFLSDLRWMKSRFERTALKSICE